MAVSKVDAANQIENQLPQANVANNRPFRNIIINGDMSIAQRATSATALGHQTYHTVDRWSQNITSSTLAFTGEQSTDSPDGFDYSYKISCTTAEASLAASSRFFPFYRVEDSNLGFLKFGSSSAVDLTMSFYVKSNKTGTYQINLWHSNVSGYISGTYVISSANTWERKIITFKGDQGTAMDNDAGRGLQLEFVLAGGSDYTGGTFIPNTTTTYPSYVANTRATSQGVNLADSDSNTWQITGLQLEVGSIASDFEFSPHDVNFYRCLRYYQHSFNEGTAYDTTTDVGKFRFTGEGNIANRRYFLKFSSPMRTTPTVTFTQTEVDGGGSATTDGRLGTQSMVITGSSSGRSLITHYKCEAELWLVQ